MQHDKLRELAVVLTERVKQNASIDWTIKESVRAKLKVIIKRTLRQYGYPPDMQKLATEIVLKQAELIANEFTVLASSSMLMISLLNLISSSITSAAVNTLL
jgi:type I restriction enzyme R subunit